MNPVDASCTAAAKQSSALQAGSKCMNYRDAKIGKPVWKGKSYKIGEPVCHLTKNEHPFLNPVDAFSPSSIYSWFLKPLSVLR